MQPTTQVNSRAGQLFHDCFGVCFEILLVLRDLVVALINFISWVVVQGWNRPNKPPPQVIRGIDRSKNRVPTVNSKPTLPAVKNATSPSNESTMSAESGFLPRDRQSGSDDEQRTHRGRTPPRSRPVVEYTTMIKACGASKNWQRVLQLIREMHDSNIELDGIAYNSAIAVCSGAGRWREALALLQQASGHPDVITYNATIKACQVKTN